VNNPDVIVKSVSEYEIEAAKTRIRDNHAREKNEYKNQPNKGTVEGDLEDRFTFPKKYDGFSSESNRLLHNFKPRCPRFEFSTLVLPEKTIKILMREADSPLVENIVFKKWGLERIAVPRNAINFYGPPGTGKTLAAHAIADYLERDILIVSYAEIESKFHGEGPKNIRAVFEAAEKHNAVLLLDEADSMLSKRLTRVTGGSEQAINSMRSQLLVSLEDFKGVVIFCTNLIENYDNAFETRITSIEFSLPNEECRAKIWDTLFVKQCPRSDDVDFEELANKYDDVCGRDIRNCIVNAARTAALENTIVSKKHIDEAMEEIIDSRFDKSKTPGISVETKTAIGKRIKKKLTRKRY